MVRRRGALTQLRKERHRWVPRCSHRLHSAAPSGGRRVPGCGLAALCSFDGRATHRGVCRFGPRHVDTLVLQVGPLERRVLFVQRRLGLFSGRGVLLDDLLE